MDADFQSDPIWGWRDGVAAGLLYSGALAGMRRLSRNYERGSAGLGRIRTEKSVILAYHRVGRGGVPLYTWMDPIAFDRQMRYLAEKYEVVPLGEIAEGGYGKTGRQRVAVTFDDGYRDVYTHAFPVLKKYRIPATVFLTAGAIETGEISWYDRVLLAVLLHPGKVIVDSENHLHPLDSSTERIVTGSKIIMKLRKSAESIRDSYCAELWKQAPIPREETSDRMLTWAMVREMHSAGIEFGAHTISHRVTAQLPADALRTELAESKQIIEKNLGKTVHDFAYPFGQPWDCGAGATALLRELGYRSAVTTTWGVNTAETDPYSLYRIQIGEGTTFPMFCYLLNEVFFDGRTGHSPFDSSISLPQQSLASAGKVD